MDKKTMELAASMAAIVFERCDYHQRDLMHDLLGLSQEQLPLYWVVRENGTHLARSIDDVKMLESIFRHEQVDTFIIYSDCTIVQIRGNM